MTFEPLNDRFVHNLEHSLAFPAAPAPSASSPASSPAGLFLSDVPGKPLNWLWPGRIPFGHLTLLDAIPGCGLSLFALTLAARISSGSPLPDGTPTLPGNVVLFAPYDSASDTLKPRLEAAGGDPANVLLFRPPIEDASRTTTRARSFALPCDLHHLANTIRHLDARLVILDPASAIPGLSRCLPALIELAHQTNCAFLLTRSLSQPPADPMRSSGPTSPLQEAVRSRMLLTTDPSDERHYLLLTTRHSLCAQPTILAYDILFSDGGIPGIQWLDERDRSQLARLCTGSPALPASASHPPLLAEQRLPPQYPGDPRSHLLRPHSGAQDAHTHEAGRGTGLDRARSLYHRQPSLPGTPHRRSSTCPACPNRPRHSITLCPQCLQCPKPSTFTKSYE